jgi:hypothetical protein
MPNPSCCVCGFPKVADDPSRISFVIEIITEGIEVWFCSRHSFPAEVLSQIGLDARAVIDRVRKVARERGEHVP